MVYPPWPCVSTAAVCWLDTACFLDHAYSFGALFVAVCYKTGPDSQGSLLRCVYTEQRRLCLLLHTRVAMAM